MNAYPDTYGWDTVFAVSITAVNVALKKVTASPRYAVSSAITGGTATVDWSFVNWRIVDTPGGDRLVVMIDFNSGSTLTRTSSTGQRVVRLDQPTWSCRIEFQAHFDEADPVTRRLRARTSQGGSWATVEIVPGDLNAPFGDVSALQLMLVDWFNNNELAVKLFQQEFVSVDVGAALGSGGLAWLKPRTLGYAGAVMADNVTKAIGILAMTTDKSPAAATLALSPYAMLANAKAGFVVSRELVMRNLIMPACASAFSDDGQGNLADFEVFIEGNATMQVRNSAALRFKHDLDGEQRVATLAAQALNVSLNGDTLSLKMTPMNVETTHPGFTLDAKIQERLTMSLIDKPDTPGAKFFALTNSAPQEPEVTVVMAPWVTVTMAVATALALVLAGALAVVSFKGPLMSKMGLSSQSAKIWARVLAGVGGAVGFVGSMAPEWMKLALEGQTHQIPEFAPFLTAGLGNIRWPDGTQAVFVAAEGQFANGMLITIDPKF